MILYLLKNPRFGAQIILGLMLVLEAIPARSEDPLQPGVKCYSCDDCLQPHEYNQAIKECPVGRDACFKTGYTGYLSRGCYSQAKAKCISNVTMGKDCILPGDNQALDERLAKCFEESKKEGETVQLPEPDWKTCVCTGDLCNEGPVFNGTDKGLYCYHCRYCNQATYYNQKTRTCKEGDHCLIESTDDGKVVNKGCFDTQGVKCFNAKYGDCVTLETRGEKSDYAKYIRTCSNNSATLLTPDSEWNKGPLEVCTCTTGYCNTAEDLTSHSKLIVIAFIVSSGMIQT